MQFTDEQKLIIALLTGIHAHLKVDDGLDPEFIQSAVFSDRTWALGMRYDAMFGTSEVPPQVKNVMNILEMWDRIEASFEAMSPDDQARLAELTTYARGGVRFPGFDGNNEEEYGIARVLIRDLGRWKRFAEYDLNSHAPSVEAYSRMLTALPRVTGFNYEISVEELAAVLNEWTHPSNR